MIKKLIIVLVVLALLAGGALAFAVFNANSLAQRYKPDLEKLASDALGSEVTLGEITASVFPNAKLVVDKVVVEHEGETLTLDNLTLKIALLPLLRRTLTIQTLELVSPEITVYLEEDGIFIAGLPREAPAEASESATTIATATESSGEIPLDVKLESFALRDGSILIKDSIADAEYAVTDINVFAALSLEEGVVRLAKLDGQAVTFDDLLVSFEGQNVTYALTGGAIGIESMSAELLDNVLTLSGRLDPSDSDQAVKLTSEGIDLASLGPLYDVFAPGLNDLGVGGVAKPTLTFAFTEDGGYLAKGTLDLTKTHASVADLALTDVHGRVEIEADAESMGFHTEGLEGKIGDSPILMKVATRLDNKNAGVESLSIEAFEGKADLTTELLMEGDMPFTTTVNVTGMQFEPMVAAVMPDTPQTVTGVLDVQGKVEGTFNEDLMPSIVGHIAVAMTDGIVKDVNLGQQALGAVTGIPFLSGSLLQAVPESLRAFLESDHTVLQSVSGSFDLAKEQMTTDDLKVVSDFFELDAEGTVDFDTTVDLKTTITFSKAFSDGLASTTEDIRVLFDDEGRLVFPMKVSGLPPDLSVMPDLKDITERAARGLVREKADDLLDEALGLEEGEEDKTGIKKKVKGLLNRFRKPKDNGSDN